MSRRNKRVVMCAVALMALLISGTTPVIAQVKHFPPPTPEQQDEEGYKILEPVRRNDTFTISLKNSTGKWYNKTVHYNVFGDDTLYATFTDVLYFRLDSIKGIHFNVFISEIGHPENKLSVTPVIKGHLYTFDLKSLPETGDYGPPQFDLVITDQKKNILHTISWDRYLVKGSD